MENHVWDDSCGPLAYLITFRTYGTWLHGDDRNSVDLHGRNIYGTPKVEPSQELVRRMTANMKGNAFVMASQQRQIVERAIRSVSEIRGYRNLAINVRTNHVHTVTASYRKPESIMNAYKANATRELRNAGLAKLSQQIWSRGGSTRYLWKPKHLEAAINYVLYGQGDEFPDF